MTPFIEIFQYDLPLARPLNLKGNIITRRQGLVLKTGRGSRKVGYGEISPLPGFSVESFEQAKEALVTWARNFKSLQEHEAEAALDFFIRTPSVLFGVECATLALTRSAIRKPRMFKGERTRIPVCGLIMGTGEEALAHAARLHSQGYEAVKLKVGRQAPAADAELVRRVRGVFPEPGLLRLDANRAWDVDSAVAFARAIDGCRIDYIEEPLANPHLLPDLAAHTRLPIALDESLAEGLQDDDAFTDLQWAKAMILKPTILGGIAACEELACEAVEMGLQPVISSSFESGLGLGMLAHLAAALTEEEIPAGLDTYDWLAGDILEQRFAPRDGHVHLEDVDAAVASINTERMERIFSA